MANASIFAAFERMWQHVVAALGSKSDTDHTHTISNVTDLQSSLDAKQNAIVPALATSWYTETDINYSNDYQVRMWRYGHMRMIISNTIIAPNNGELSLFKITNESDFPIAGSTLNGVASFTANGETQFIKFWITSDGYVKAHISGETSGNINISVAYIAKP